MIDVRDSYFQSDPFSFVTTQQQQAHSASSSAVAGRNSRGTALGAVDSPSSDSGEVGFHVFTGVESFPIKECGWNSGWIKDCFGAGVLNAVGSKVRATQHNSIFFFISILVASFAYTTTL